MAAVPSIDVSGWLSEQLAQASPDLLREMITTFAQALMGATGPVIVNRPGFDAASFLAKDADHAEEVSRRAAGTCDPDGP